MDAPRVTRYKQIILIGSVMVTTFVAICLFSSWLKAREIREAPGATTRMSLPTAANADLQNLWVQRLESKNKEQNEKLKDLNQQVSEQSKEFNNFKLELTNMLNEFKQQLTEKATLLPSQQPQNFEESLTKEPWPTANEPINKSNNYVSQNNFTANTTENSKAGGIFSHQFTLQGEHKFNQKLGEYLPAGSFVKSIVLGGLDAPAGVTAQSDPRPSLLRLVDLSVLPNKARHDIKDCHVIAAGFGDVSSERVYLRTERLSCTLRSGRIFEQKIKAYVAGEDGKDGLRGSVLRREGDLLFNSFMSGAISGFGKGMSQSLGITSTSPLGSTKTMTGQDVMKSGLYGGMGESADSLQKYFIQRAEQMQPVVQISAGREATIILLEGVELNVHKTT